MIVAPPQRDAAPSSGDTRVIADSRLVLALSQWRVVRIERAGTSAFGHLALSPTVWNAAEPELRVIAGAGQRSSLSCGVPAESINSDARRARTSGSFTSRRCACECTAPSADRTAVRIMARRLDPVRRSAVILLGDHVTRRQGARHCRAGSDSRFFTEQRPHHRHHRETEREPPYHERLPTEEAGVV